MDVPDTADTVLTPRQAEVLAYRERGLTQPEIAERIGTSVANVSSVESRARENVARARETVTLSRLLGTVERFRVTAGTDLREIVDRTFEAGDAAGLRIAYTDPELAAHLREHLADHLEDRRLTGRVAVGITREGDVVTHPSAVLEGTLTGRG